MTEPEPAQGDDSDKEPPPHWVCVGRFYYDPKKLHLRQVQRLQEIAAFYDDHTVHRLLVPVAKAEFDVSLRLLDYCCTNYAKKTRVVICENRMAVHLYWLYKDWLRQYRRRTFDPFRRRERIRFQGYSKEWLDTTVAQLNFLRWADYYGVIRYVRANLHTIEQDMMRTLTDSKARRRARSDSVREHYVTKKRRTELSQAPRNKCTVYVVRRSILFED